ncbi:MAG: isoamylase early set domain-containing protein [Candidatus Cloacimonetes bacterium]|nr:isoamylase early set domain-containing protein [Candidatus Cloacimonadota bacterium]
MLKKNYSQSGKVCRVTFKLPPEIRAEKINLCGEFNDWDKTDLPLRKLKDGSFSLTVSLEADRSYRFRYLVNGTEWENDWEADSYIANEFGSEDSVVKV